MRDCGLTCAPLGNDDGFQCTRKRKTEHFKRKGFDVYHVYDVDEENRPTGVLN